MGSQNYCFKTLTRCWTPTAIDCYKIGCNCSRCVLYKIYFLNSNQKCNMKKVVIELVKKYGIPTEENCNNGN